MQLTLFDLYIIAVNLVGFLLFALNTRLAKGNSGGGIGGVLMLFAVAGGSLGLFVSALIFDPHGTKSRHKKDIMMLRVAIVCLLVIQTAAVLALKGFIRDELTFDAVSFFGRHKWALIYLAAVNIIAFAAFGADKLKAVKNKRRIRIVTLLSLAFIGGSVGALVGMRVFRHKTQKDYFYIGVPLMLVMQLVVVLYLMNMKI